MNCVDIQNLLSAYIDGECSNNEKRIIEEHLEQCSDCIEEYRLLKTIISDLGNSEEVDLPDGFHNDLMDKIKSSTPRVKNKKVRSIKTWYSVTAAAFLFIIIFGVIGTATLTRWTNYSKDEMMYEASEESEMEESSASDFDDSAPKTTSIEPGNDMLSLVDKETNLDGNELYESEEFASQTPSSDSTYTTVTENKRSDYSGDSIDENKINVEIDRDVAEKITLTTNDESTQVDEDKELEERTSNHPLPMKNFVVIIVIVLIVISIPIIIIIYSVSKRTKK